MRPGQIRIRHMPLSIERECQDFRGQYVEGIGCMHSDNCASIQEHNMYVGIDHYHSLVCTGICTPIKINLLEEVVKNTHIAIWEWPLYRAKHYLREDDADDDNDDEYDFPLNIIPNIR